MNLPRALPKIGNRCTALPTQNDHSLNFLPLSPRAWPKVLNGLAILEKNPCNSCLRCPIAGVSNLITSHNFLNQSMTFPTIPGSLSNAADHFSEKLAKLLCTASQNLLIAFPTKLNTLPILLKFINLLINTSNARIVVHRAFAIIPTIRIKSLIIWFGISVAISFILAPTSAPIHLRPWKTAIKMCWKA